MLNFDPHVERVLCGIVAHAELRPEVAAVRQLIAERQMFDGVWF